MPTIKIHISDEQLQRLYANGEIVITLGDDRQPDGDDSLKNREMQHAPTETSFFAFGQYWAEQLRKTGNLRTAETYRTALNALSRFLQDDKLTLSEVTPILMEQYQSYLRSRQLTMNTISFLLRILRAIYNKGVRQGLVCDCQPFRDVYTGIARTQKRALTLEMLQRIKQLRIDDQRLLFARDMFLLSFYLRGMAFVDMANLRRTDIIDHQLHYKRHKTGQMLSIRWERQMEEIVSRHSDVSMPYLLPIIRRQNGKERNQYRHRQTLINHDLKEVARLADVTVNLTMYCARHTWATVARSLQVPMNVISQAMGHNNERTTEIYIRNVDSDAVDGANAQILRVV
ncbi:MAG: site-specific integrase [Prevotella sp.]|nr:site-specific integrase [Prevotella sp.]